jgi:hypothetical protein
MFLFLLFCKLVNFVFQIFPLFIPEMTADFMSYIVQTSNYFFSLLQDASTKHLHRILFWAKAPISFQVFPTFLISSSTVLLHVLLGLPPLCHT